MAGFGVDRDSAAGGSGSSASAIPNAIVDAKGDIVTATAADTPARLAVGANDSFLVADSTQIAGLKWSAGSEAFQSIVTGATAETAPAVDDIVMLSDVSLTPDNGRSMTLANLWKIINGLTEDASPDEALDFIATYDASATAAKKVTLTSLLKRLNSLTEDTTPDTAADFVLTYDVSASTVKKALLKNAGALTQGTVVASTSGTSIDFTGIPAGTKRITISLSGVSLNGAANLMVQIGDSGGIETTVYASAGGDYVPTANHTTNTTGFIFTGGNGLSEIGAGIIHGQITLTLVDASTFTWVASGTLSDSNTANTATGSGSKSTSAELDRVRITTVAGTATFDAGKINIQYAR